MNKVRIATVFAPYVVVGAVYLVAQFLGADEVTDFTKPLLMPILLAGFLFAVAPIRSEIAILGTVAITLSWLGDVTLGSVGEIWFLVGLGFFLLAHIAYVVLFLRRLRTRPFSWWALIYVAWWLGLVVVLWPHLGNLLIPVAVYGLVLGAMGAIGLSCNRWIAIGGALFVISDSLLGLNRFHPEFDLPYVHVLIMLTYITAQGLIAYGAVRTAYTLSAVRTS
ncbi:MAG TPA: lysoplasmalogenase [Terrimesophilobacter sp.]|nr:lysoplasmalogenase [Terrimesophilobacter sp.]